MQGVGVGVGVVVGVGSSSSVLYETTVYMITAHVRGYMYYSTWLF